MATGDILIPTPFYPQHVSVSEVLAQDMILNEYTRATSRFGPFASAHEGYSVILEELDELWEEIKKNKSDKKKMFEEACQVAAMAMRFMVDVCGSEL